MINFEIYILTSNPLPRKNLIDWSINLSSNKTFDSSTLLPLPLIYCLILFTATDAIFINSGIIEIIEETNKGLIPLPLRLVDSGPW